MKRYPNHRAARDAAALFEQGKLDDAEQAFRALPAAHEDFAALMLAKITAVRGDVRSAVMQVKSLLGKQLPRWLEMLSRWELGCLLRSRKRYPEAKGQFERLLWEPLFPKTAGDVSALWHQVLACALEQDDLPQLEEAVRAAETAGVADAREFLGRYHCRKENYQAALVEYEALYKGAPRRNISGKLADVLIGLNRFQEAVRYLKESLEEGDPLAASKLIRLYYKRDQNRLAYEYYCLAVSESLPLPDWRLIFRMLLDAGEKEEARQLLERMAVPGFHPEPELEFLAFGYELLDDHRKALEILTRHPNSLWGVRALVRLRLGDLKNAAKDARQAIRNAPPPRQGGLMMLLGDIYCAMRKPHLAEPLYQDALSEGATPATFKMGLLALERGNPDAANRWLSRSIQEVDDDMEDGEKANRYHSYGLCCLRRGEDEEGCRWLMKNVALGNTEDAMIVAQAHLNHERPEEALKLYDMCLAKGIPGARRGYAMSLWRLERFSAASVFLEQAWEEEKDEAAAKMLMSLYRLPGPLQNRERAEAFRLILRAGKALRKSGKKPGAKEG